jgi:poly(rC)-binding protein 2/3/4
MTVEWYLSPHFLEAIFCVFDYFISASRIQMAGHRNSHGKRHSDYAENGGGKRRNPGDDSYAPGPDDTVYRYLCASRKIGSIIGRGGEIAKQLRTETQAKIRIGESVPGCEERVITIFSSSRETNTIDDMEDKVCPAQDALFRVHERLASDESPGNEDIEEVAPQVTVRLLVPSDQIGCIIGKGGHIIQGIRSETGAQIRVLSNDHIPACAINGDELLQVSHCPHQFLHYLNKLQARPCLTCPFCIMLSLC